MKYVISGTEAKENDAYTIKNYAKSIDLMENAGRGCYEEIVKHIDKKNTILVVCGSGGNGGDGLVIARYLNEQGYKTYVYMISNKLKDETLINYNRYKGEFVIDIYDFLKNSKVDVIIDALLGIGLTTTVKENYASLINYLNQLNAYKISIDINSGLNSDNGKSLGTHFKSDLTLTIQWLKYGLFFNCGEDSYKELKIIDAGIKPYNTETYSMVIQREDLKKLFLSRERNSNKGTYGRNAIIGGSKLTPGAELLSFNALASLRCGVGYANMCIPSSLYNVYALKVPEAIYTLFPDVDGQIKFNEESLQKIIHYSSIVIGPGIGVSEDVYQIIAYLLKNFEGNLAIDADGLNSLSKYGVEILKYKKCNSVVLTPHIKEFSRLSGYEIDKILENPIDLAKDFAKKYGIIINLKNNVSVITDGKNTYININGNPGLAKGGSGDVLSGICGGLLTKSDNLLLRVAASAYILGRSADLAIKEINENSLLARDVIDYINVAIKEINF